MCNKGVHLLVIRISTCKTFIHYLIFACSDYWRKHSENEKDNYFQKNQFPGYSSPLWLVSLIPHRRLRWTTAYFPQPLNQLIMNPVLFCSTAPDFSHSLLLQVYVILSFTFPYRSFNRQYHRTSEWLVILKYNKWNSRSFVPLKIGHGTFYNLLNFQWRGSEQSRDSKHVAIQTSAVIQIWKFDFPLYSMDRNGSRTFIIIFQERGRT
jgi:hypothetical protein